MIVFNLHSWSLDLHFWYLDFISIVLTAEIVPGPRACWAICAGIHQGCRRTILAAVHHCALLDAVHRDGYAAAIGIDQSARLTKFRIVEGLQKVVQV